MYVVFTCEISVDAVAEDHAKEEDETKASEDHTTHQKTVAALFLNKLEEICSGLFTFLENPSQDLKHE